MSKANHQSLEASQAIIFYDMKKNRNPLYLNIRSIFLFIYLFFYFLIISGMLIANAKPARIVSLSPSITEILFSINAGGQIIAADSYSNYPPEAPLTSLSSFDPNLEAIASYKPDLVILSYDIGQLIRSLETIGIKTLLLPAPKDFDSILNQIRLLGKITGKIQQANELSKKIKSEMTRLMAERQGKKKWKIYHEIDENFYSPSSHSFIGNIYKLLNFINIADQADKNILGYPKLSPEYIMVANPEIIVLTNGDLEYIDRVKKRPGWNGINAVKNNRIFVLNPDVGSRWGPRIIDFAEDIVTEIE